MKNSLKLIVISLFALACESGSNKELDKLESEVMAVHDEIMPKMNDIMTLKDELSANLKKTITDNNPDIRENNFTKNKSPLNNAYIRYKSGGLLSQISL